MLYTVLFLLKKGNVRLYSGTDENVVTPDRYNEAGDQETHNLEMVETISDILGLPLKHKLVDAQLSRPGQDLRYALGGTKLRGMGWEPPENFLESLRRMVKWTAVEKLWCQNEETVHNAIPTKTSNNSHSKPKNGTKTRLLPPRVADEKDK